jgi:hypothetical protein
MNIEVLGQVKYISKPKEVKGEGTHSFVTVWVKTLEDSYLAINCWDEHIEKTKDFKINGIVTLNCRVESHRNKKNQDLFYHKLLLT